MKKIIIIASILVAGTTAIVVAKNVCNPSNCPVCPCPDGKDCKENGVQCTKDCATDANCCHK